ncbi:FeoA-like protein [Xenococcus sp. PCC 7305]|uniref:FeoA family protein n=1 Tax=Xenococcus sp. PCC 7305 TaxID=102125 RepID=UPI0002AC84B2|nr:FeoA family protein [Xenococcus sp. PCC 7305]ELS02963.1 FeoA-like protein [Xenococcus sp. PCC 7305]
MQVRTKIRELSLGTIATVVGYEKAYGGYVGKLIAVGLTPGKKFVVLDSLSLDNRVVILLQEKIIQLYKPEADAICVEEVKEEPEM